MFCRNIDIWRHCHRKVFQVTRLDEIAKAESRERNRRKLRTECEKLGERQEPSREKRATSVGAGTPAAGPESQREVHQRGGMIGRLNRGVFWGTEAKSMASVG